MLVGLVFPTAYFQQTNFSLLVYCADTIVLCLGVGNRNGGGHTSMVSMAIGKSISS